MPQFVAFTTLCLASVLLAVQGEVGSVHKEHQSSQHSYSTDEAKKELKELLKGKSDDDILELRKKLKASHKKHLQKHVDEAAAPAKTCPSGFGSQRSDGCCLSKWADDLTQAKYECQSSHHWEVFTGGANSDAKFICCPPPKDEHSKDDTILKEDMDELRRLVTEKDGHSKHESSTKSHSRHQRVESEIEEDAREQMIEKIDEMEARKHTREEMKEWQREKAWERDAERAANSESSFLLSLLQMLLAIPVILAIGVGYLIMIGSDLAAVEIPGLGTFNLRKIAQDVLATATGKKQGHITKTTNFDDIQNPLQSTYGSYGGYGSNGGYGSSPGVPSYDSSNVFRGTGESQALFAAPAPPPKKSIAMQPVDDLGL